VTPLNDANTVKVNLQAGGSVFANHAQVTTPDLTADNGVVHVINEVILPFSTVVDVAIDNDFTYLTAALAQEGLVPALSNPFGTFTVFPPTNTAFDDLAEALNTDIAGLLALENLSAVLLYHVIGSINESGDLVNGNVTTLQGQSVAISIDGGVTVNSSNVVLADVTAFNGVVHVIDAVLLPVDDASINNNNTSKLNIYPNPSTSTFSIAGVEDANLRIVDLTGKEILALQYEGGQINIEALPSGVYFIHVSNKQFNTVQRLIKE
jgi:transforming growth factor-beta-induced protein